MYTTATIALAFSASVSVAQDAPDLVFTSLEIVSVEFVNNMFEIGFEYEITNIGSASIDLAGPDPFNGLDNIGFQTYLASNEELMEPIHAAGGWLIDTNPGEHLVLATNESRRGTLFANTNQLPDPAMLDPYNWLVIDILTQSVPEEFYSNNRAIIFIPSPGAPALLALGCTVASIRRRRDME